MIVPLFTDVSFQNQVELTALRDALVGTEDDHGLSFEQKKRLSIAVELAASPSIIFLDEVSAIRSNSLVVLLALLTACVEPVP